MNGSLTINDIRNEAIDAREQLRELMEDLGPSGTSLQGYDGILNGFIKKTDPTHGTHAKANPATTLTSSPFASSPFASSPFASSPFAPRK